MASPNVEGSTNAAVLTGGEFGAVVGETTAETVGFYGNVGVAQQSGAAITTLAELVTALQNLGLLG